MGLFVVIPQDYDDLPEAIRKQTVPICIAAFDPMAKPSTPTGFPAASLQFDSIS
jgi:hypothetical protein